MSSEDEGATRKVADVFDSDSEDDVAPPSKQAHISDEEDEQPRKRVLKRKGAIDSEASDQASDNDAAEDNQSDRAESDRESGPEDDKHRMDDVFASDEEDEPQDRSNREESGGAEEDEDNDDLFGEDEDDDRSKKSKKRKERAEKGERRKKQRREEDGEGAEPQQMSLIKQQIADEKKKRLLKKQMVDEAAVEAWVQKVINDMKVAAELDREANMEKRPGTNKLKLLPLVSEELRIRNESKGRRADVDEIDRQELYIENGVLNMIAAWLEPLPDKSLPAVQIRTAMIEALNDLPVEQHREELKESQVGHRVRYLSKHPKEMLDNKKRCDELMTKWARHVCNLPTDYSSISMEERKDIARREREALEERRRRALEAGVSPSKSRRESSNTPAASSQDLDDALGGSQRILKPGEPGWRRHAAIPQPDNRDYFISPQIDVPDRVQHKKKGPSRIDQLKKRAKETQLKTKANPLTKMSVEGRGL